jgi:hypothetical protein
MVGVLMDTSTERLPTRNRVGLHSKTGPRWTVGGVVLAFVLAALIISGCLIRLWILGNAPINSDEATAGLMAHQIMMGHTYAFFWGQSYGGVEPYVLALNFWVFGQSPFVLNITPSILALIISVLVWRIGLRLFQPTAAATAAVLSWIWSESTLWNSTRETGFREMTPLLGLVVLLQAIRISQNLRSKGQDQIIDWAILGAAGGLGFWSSPEIVYFAIPAIVMVAATLRSRTAGTVIPRLAVAIVSCGVGALPWIWATLTGHGAALPSSPEPYFSRLGTFFSHVLPMLLGLRVEGVGLWEGGHRFGVAVYLVLLVLLVGAVVIVAIRVPDARILSLTLLLFPILYAAFPTSWFWNDGRYAISLTPVLSLIITGGLWQILRPPLVTWAGCAVLVVALVSTLIAFNDGYEAISTPSELTTFTANPNPAITTLAWKLNRLGVTHAYAGYWVANALTFVSDNRITGIALDEDRNPPSARDIGSHPGWIFVPADSIAADSAQLGSTTNLEPDSVSEAQLIAWLNAHAIPYRLASTNSFNIVLPSRRVQPDQLAGAPT